MLYTGRKSCQNTFQAIISADKMALFSVPFRSFPRVAFFPISRFRVSILSSSRWRQKKKKKGQMLLEQKFSSPFSIKKMRSAQREGQSFCPSRFSRCSPPSRRSPRAIKCLGKSKSILSTPFLRPFPPFHFALKSVAMSDLRDGNGHIFSQEKLLGNKGWDKKRHQNPLLMCDLNVYVLLLERLKKSKIRAKSKALFTVAFLLLPS